MLGGATRAQDAYRAAYAYHYGDRLYQITWNFPGESNSRVYEYEPYGKCYPSRTTIPTLVD